MDANEVEKLTKEDIDVLSERIKSVLTQAENECERDENGRIISEIDAYSVCNQFVLDIIIQISHNLYEALGIVDTLKDDLKQIWFEHEEVDEEEDEG